MLCRQEHLLAACGHYYDDVLGRFFYQLQKYILDGDSCAYRPVKVGYDIDLIPALVGHHRSVGDYRSYRLVDDIVAVGIGFDINDVWVGTVHYHTAGLALSARLSAVPAAKIACGDIRCKMLFAQPLVAVYHHRTLFPVLLYHSADKSDSLFISVYFKLHISSHLFKSFNIRHKDSCAADSYLDRLGIGIVPFKDSRGGHGLLSFLRVLLADLDDGIDLCIITAYHKSRVSL